MPRLPQVKPRDLAKFIEKKGYVARRTKSGHVFYKHPNGMTTVISMHNKPLAKGTLSGILKQTGITLEELLKFI